MTDMTLQDAGYTGPIEEGMEFTWEEGNHRAEVKIVVTRVQEIRGDERRIWTKTLQGTAKNPAGETAWNEESRFREAVTPVVSGALIPAPDAQLAVAEALRRAGEVAKINCPAPAGGPFSHTNSMRVIAQDIEKGILALAPADALAQVQNMRKMLDQALEQNAELTAAGNVLRAERDALLKVRTFTVDHALETERAARVAAEAKLAALVDAVAAMVDDLGSEAYGLGGGSGYARICTMAESALAAAKGEA